MLNEKMAPKTIIFFVGKLEVGGAGKMVKYAAGIAKERFDKVIVASFYEKTKDLEHITNVECVGLALSTKKKSWRLDAIKEIRKFVAANNPCVCCAFVSDIAVMVRLATLFMPKILFVSAERGDPYTLPGSWKRLVSWAYRHSDYCLFQLDNARDFFGKSIRSKSFVIPNPYIGNPPVPYYGERKKTIVTATRFEKEKGVDILIDAFSKIHEQHPEYRLVIYGDGSLKDEFVERVGTLGISDCVDFPGYIKNVAEKVKDDGIFVLPSLYEGIPNTLIEVIAARVPTISFDCSPGGPRFLTQNGERGLLFPVGDKESLAQDINLLINDEQKAEMLSKKGPSIVDDLYEGKIRQMWMIFFTKALDSFNERTCVNRHN